MPLLRGVAAVARGHGDGRPGKGAGAAVVAVVEDGWLAALARVLGDDLVPLGHLPLRLAAWCPWLGACRRREYTMPRQK